MSTNLPPALEFVLKEMCNRVNANYNNINFTEENWFLKHTWTSKEQDDFINWLTQQIISNKEVRKLFNLPSHPRKKIAEAAAKWFVFQYGWKVNDNNLNGKEEV